MSGLPRDLLEARTAVGRLWSEAVTALPPSDLSYHFVLPGYFVDRYALLVCAGRSDLAASAINAQIEDWATSEPEYADRIQQNWVPTDSLAGWVPTDDDPPADTPFGLWLRDCWAAYVTELNLPAAIADVAPVSGESWLSLTRRSVFYPSLPAIPGANYFDFLDESDRQAAVSRFGPTAAIDFFVFMLQVHENGHLIQIGEPLTNEILQAAIWVGFLDKEDLWSLQRNSITGRSCCLELALVRAHPDLLRLPAITYDSAISFSTTYSYPAYLLVGAWGHCFDSGGLRYGQYLDGVRVILTDLADHGPIADIDPMTGFTSPATLQRLLAEEP
jgi:hypothetical protein